MISYFIGGFILYQIMKGSNSMEFIKDIMIKNQLEGEFLVNDFQPDRYTIVIAAGHSEQNKNINRNGINEHDYTEEIGKRIYNILKDNDINVIFLNRYNHDDWYNERKTVKEIINASKGGFDVQLHLNDSKSKTGKGVLTAYYAGNNEGKLLAEKISKYIHENCNIAYHYNNKGITANNESGFPNLLHMLDITDNTSVLVEIFFLFNDYEFNICTSEAGKNCIAESISSALENAIARKILTK